MSAEQPTGKAKGGHRRAEVLSPEEKKAIAQKGALARWGAQATHKGNFKDEFGMDVECYVLNDAIHTAVISQTGMGKSIGLSSRGNAFPRFLASKAMSGTLGAELSEKIQNPLKFQWAPPGAQQSGTTTVYGYDATILIDVCKAILRADADGKLKSQQRQVAKQAAIIIGASAKSGIQGLIYKLAGYDATREEVVAAFKLFVQQEAREYEREFPPQLYSEWYRLYQLPKPERGRPWKAKHLTIDHIYYPLARSAGKILKLTREQRQESSNHQNKLHQFLSEVGVKALRTHLGQVLGIARISKTQDEYEHHINTLFGVQPDLFG